MNFGFIVIGGIGIVFLCLRLYDHFVWNGGVCRKTGSKWVFVQFNHDGGEMYKTECGDRHYSFGWPRPKRNP